MNFASDNAGPAHPKVWEALARADQGYAMPYGNDPLSRDVADRLRDLFGIPDAAIALVATGTAANSLAKVFVLPSAMEKLGTLTTSPASMRSVSARANASLRTFLGTFWE